MRIPALACLTLLAASPVLAAGDALVIGNSRYTAIQSLFGAARVSASARAMRDRGLEVTELQDASTETMREGFAEFVAGLDPDEGPVVVVLTGAFLHGPGGAYLLPVNADAESDPAEVLTGAFPLDAALAVLAHYPGRAFLVLGESAASPDAAPFLSPGLGPVQAPQGVSVLRGAATDVARFAAEALAVPGRPLQEAVAEYELTLEGYAPRDLVLLRADEVTEPAPQPPAAEAPEDDSRQQRADDLAWRLAQREDSAEGYRSYLEDFPEGQHARAAQQRLSAIEAEPFYQARRAEERLDLSRDERRGIQRDLSILGFDTRGVDGIFGPGTRGAVKGWQADRGIEATGYLTAQQIARIDEQAAARAAELEREAEARRAELEEKDRLFWADMQGRGDEDSVRAYLERFPDGLFVDEAREALRRIEEQRAARAAESDRQAWAEAEAGGTIAAYRAYLERFPGGAFSAEAESRLRRLEGESARAGAVAEARAEENAMNLNAVARRLAEARLAQIGLDTGRVDGRFDEDTRRALRRYQETRGLRVSGFLDEQTVVRLLADGVLGAD